MAEEARVLVADDEPAIRSSLVTILERNGFSCAAAATGDEAIEMFDADSFDVVISDIRMPGASGVDVMRHARSRAPDTIVLLITAHGALETAIEAVREGASDYVLKPIRFETLILRIRNLLRMRDLEWDNRVLRIEMRSVSLFEGLVGSSAVISDLKQAVLRMGRAPGNVLISGESGTGKELVARAIHDASQKKRGAFVPVNCGSIPETLLESEFFGYKRGAFTGADADRDGLFQEARGGTLFLDEVAELPLGLQPKILRAIETKEVRPVGSTQSVSVDVRIVAATNRNLDELVKNGDFREDLFFRLNVFNVAVPPLRERPEDIAPLAEHFLVRYRAELRSPVQKLTPEAMSVLETYTWKGNVRELQNVIQRALITATSPVINANLVEDLLALRPRSAQRNLKDALRDFEFRHVQRVLEETGGDKRLAAERLGISLASLYNKLKDA